MEKTTSILFIDDSSMIRNVVQKFLNIKGYTTYVAENGKEGIELFNEKKPDLVITDIKMPILNGFEVLLYINKNSPDTPVIIISGEGEMKDLIEAIHLGAWDYISKPIEDFAIIEYAIQKSMEKSELIKKNRLYEQNLELLINERTRELEKANLQLELTITAIVNSFSTITEKKDQYTAGHQVRVSQLAVKIAEKMNLQKERIDSIKIAAMLHDIGKIYVPVEILTKPSKLDINEFEIIKEHCKIGYDILKNIPFPWPIADIVYQHHERLDGSGYPNKIKNNNIMIESQIIAIADTVEAMSFHRPYRPAIGLKKALIEINKKSGILFNPDCVEICNEICKNNDNIFDNIFNEILKN